ncbi:hypothetical protein STAQ_41950 [Allostella sp. ATCC 35155]|nr:hypothetical protein STAQ_41950 [Stella sp. ATCC 35155]
MPRLPQRPDIDHLKRQAKALLARYRTRDPAAIARFRNALPAAAGRDDDAVAALDLHLHDAQSCLAREHGFRSWSDLRSFVIARAARAGDHAGSVRAWLALVYAGDIAGGMGRASPDAAARLLDDDSSLAGDAHAACAVGDLDRLRQALADDPAWANRPGGPLALPPLVAVTHSGLLQLAAFRDRLHAAARLLLAAGADPNQSVGSRWPPASPEQPSREHRLSALYGAAGRNHDPGLTALLLDAGADPNDGESLYHALESPECTRLLLRAGARITGTNAIYRVSDLDRLESLAALLDAGADPNEPATSRPTADWGTPLLWAIRRRRSPAHVAALLAAGADAAARTPDGTDAMTLALRHGLPEVAALLQPTGHAKPLADEERFVAACAAGDEAAARRIQAARPDLPAALGEPRLRLLPELAAEGAAAAVRAMVRLGWPVATRGGDWEASALNHAVFRGDAALTRFLLEHGADWRDRHGFGDDASGTLSWASLNRPVEAGDWLGCARALVAHGMPRGAPCADGSDDIVLDGRRKRFSDEVAEFLITGR